MKSLFIELTADLTAKAGEVVRLTSSNVQSDKVIEVLENWLHAQMGAGEDHSKPEERDEYRIRIELNLTDDTFRTTHNCGNHGLAAGLVMEALRQPKL